MYFQGRALWHCSLARRTRQRILPLSEWTESDFKAAVMLWPAVLQSAGMMGETMEIIEGGNTALHIRRCMTMDEEAALSPQRIRATGGHR